MKRILKSKSAFTLIEILLTISISSVIIVSSMIIFYNSSFDNLNQRKFFSKYNEIEYLFSYMESELENAIEVKDLEDGLFLVNYSYNLTMDAKIQKIKNIKEISFLKKKENNKISIYRVALDYLNKNNDGKNKIISGIDEFETKTNGNMVNLKLKYLGNYYEKKIFLKNLKRFNYE